MVTIEKVFNRSRLSYLPLKGCMHGSDKIVKDRSQVDSRDTNLLNSSI